MTKQKTSKKRKRALKNVHVHVLVTKDQHERLKMIADREGSSVGAYIRRMINMAS